MGNMTAMAAAGLLLVCGSLGWAQADTAEPASPPTSEGPSSGDITVPAGTRVPLVMINSVSSKHSRPGDPVYLESIYPVVVDGRILIPGGTRVSGIVTYTKRPGRIKGRGSLLVRLDQMILPNGIIRDLTGRPGMLDGRSPDSLDRETGEVRSEGAKGEDAEEIARTTAAGASIGTLVGVIGGRTGTGLGIGALAGAAAGTAKVLLTRGPDAILDRGTHVEMLLERELHFTEEELRFDNGGGPRGGNYGAGPDPNRNRRARRGVGGIGRFPL